MGVFSWTVYNNGDQPADVSIMFTWQNGIGAKKDKEGGRWNEAFQSEPREGVDVKTSGVLLHDDQSSLPLTFAVAAAQKVNV